MGAKRTHGHQADPPYVESTDPEVAREFYVGVFSGDGAAVDVAHERARAMGMRIVYPLTNEPWGVRRFFVEDPDGRIVNVLAHLQPEVT